MKVIIAGATGTLGTELLHQALSNPRFTSVIALGRRAATASLGTDAHKLQNVILDEFGKEYPEDVRNRLADADACIWTIAITPTKSAGQDLAFVKHVCHDYPLIGIRSMLAARAGRGNLRIMYLSGALAERDQTKTPPIMPEHVLMRGQTENEVIKLGSDVCVAKPGFIYTPETEALYHARVTQAGVSFPAIELKVCAAAILQQVLDGFEKEPLTNADLDRLGRAALEASA